MAYIGKQPVVGNFQVCDAISVVNGQAAYTMQVSGSNVNPESANHMLVSLNGVLQKPGSSFTIAGAVITFASNLATGDVIDFIILLGNVLDIGAPSDGTVTEPKLAANTGGIVDWQAVVTSNTTMVAGRGYFVNTSGGAITMTLPSSAVKAVCPEIISLFNEAAFTAVSEGVPVFKVSPNKVIKSITSPVAKLLAKVIVEPEIVKELPGFCSIPFKLTSI